MNKKYFLNQFSLKPSKINTLQSFFGLKWFKMV